MSKVSGKRPRARSCTKHVSWSSTHSNEVRGPKVVTTGVVFASLSLIYVKMLSFG